MAFGEDRPEYKNSFPMAGHLWQYGYMLALCDARGSGASFGTREIEIPPNEVADIGEVIDWVAAQPWCDGRVATTRLPSGVSGGPRFRKSFFSCVFRCYTESTICFAN